MATVYGNIPIVTSGLTLCLDAGNLKSYPTSGSTWNDLSKRGNCTLFNSPTFSSSNVGFINLNGVNQYGDFFVPNLGTTATIEMFCRISATTGVMFFGWNLYDVYTFNNALGYNTSNGDVYGLSSAQVTNLNLVNNWRHYIFEMRTDVSYTNNKIYIDTVQQSLSQQLGSENAGQRNFNSGNGRIAGWRYDNGYRMPMNCAVFRVYNRALTRQEIQQNYNAIKWRFQ